MVSAVNGLENLELEKVKIQVNALENDAEGIHLAIQGDIDMEDPSLEITPYLLEIHGHIVQGGKKNVSLDFTELGFMNSSGIRSFVTWFMKLNELDEERMYKIKLIYDKSVTWQDSSIPVLQKLQPDNITVEHKT